jgi:SAM-dependent methyltransferase
METSWAANDEQARYWNGGEAGHWLVHEHRYERMLAPFTGHLLGAAALAAADRVLDVGCGTGSTTRGAGRVALSGTALGVDLSVPLLRRAVQRAREDGLTNVGFEQADAQRHRFTPGGFDVIISRFGVMFFGDPVAAFANVRQGLGPGGRLVFVCWQNLADNEWIVVPGAAAAQHVTLPSLDPAGPGPFSLGDRDRLAAVLGAAGLTGIGIEPLAEPLWVGHDVADAVEFFKATRIGQSLLRDADATTAARVTDAVQAALEPHVAPDGIWLGSRAWLVNAHNPTETEGSSSWRSNNV